MEARSMIGSAAGACVDRSLYNTTKERRAKRVVSVAPALAGDALTPGTCPRCGFAGLHGKPETCIRALREEICRLEFKAERPKPSEPKPQNPESPKPVADPAEHAMKPKAADAHPANRQPERGTPMNTIHNHYAAVLAHLERTRADAERGIVAIRTLMAREPAVSRTQNRPAASSATPNTVKICEFLNANPGKSYTAAQIGEGIGRKGSKKAMRSTLMRLAESQRIRKVERGRYEAVPGAAGI